MKAPHSSAGSTAGCSGILQYAKSARGLLSRQAPAIRCKTSRSTSRGRKNRSRKPLYAKSIPARRLRGFGRRATSPTPARAATAEAWAGLSRDHRFASPQLDKTWIKRGNAQGPHNLSPYSQDGMPLTYVSSIISEWRSCLLESLHVHSAVKS